MLLVCALPATAAMFGLLAALAEHEPPLETMGAFQDWVNAKKEFWWKDIKGVGASAEGKIADVTLAFFAEHPEFTQGEPAPAPDPPDDEDEEGDTDA